MYYLVIKDTEFNRVYRFYINPDSVKLFFIIISDAETIIILSCNLFFFFFLLTYGRYFLIRGTFLYHRSIGRERDEEKNDELYIEYRSSSELRYR